MTTPNKTITWDYLDLYVPLVRAFGKADSLKASDGYVLLGSDGSGGYATLDKSPDMDEDVAGYLVVRCILEQFVDENGDVVMERLAQNDPIEEGEIIEAVIAEDVAYDAAKLQAVLGPNAIQILSIMQEIGSSYALALLIPQGYTDTGMQMGTSVIPLPPKTTVKSSPDTIEQALQAESKASDASDDPNTIDSLLDDDDD